jgi:hypothetical protein
MGWHTKSIAVGIGSKFGSCQAHHVRCRSQADQFDAKSTLGKAEGSSGCTKTKTPPLSSRQKANFGGCTCAVGEDTGGEEGSIVDLDFGACCEDATAFCQGNCATASRLR